MGQFEPDFKIKKFEILITVYENSSTINIKSEGTDRPDYNEVIGVLENNKAMLLYDQSSYNRKKYKAKKPVPQRE